MTQSQKNLEEVERKRREIELRVEMERQAREELDAKQEEMMQRQKEELDDMVRDINEAARETARSVGKVSETSRAHDGRELVK